MKHRVRQQWIRRRRLSLSGMWGITYFDTAYSYHNMTRIVHKINNPPRKSLGCRTVAKVFSETLFFLISDLNWHRQIIV
jgi:hypothetical protein